MDGHRNSCSKYLGHHFRSSNIVKRPSYGNTCHGRGSYDAPPTTQNSAQVLIIGIGRYFEVGGQSRLPKEIAGVPGGGCLGTGGEAPETPGL